MDGRQVHDGAGIEDAPEVRQPPAGGGTGDEIERSGIDGDDDDPCLPLGGREIIATLSGRASSSAAVPRPRTASGATMEPAATITKNSPHTVRPLGPRCARSTPRNTKNAAATTSVSAPLATWVTVSGASTRANVCRFAHISAAPARAAAAPSQASTLTLTHAGEKSSRANSCRSTRST